MSNSFIELQIRGVDGKERKVVLPAGNAIKIGSSADSDVVIEHPSIAACHARLLFQEEIVILEPASAATKSTVHLDGEPIIAPMPARAGQEMALGSAILRWRWVPTEESPTIPAQRTDTGKSAVIQLAEEVKRGRYRAGSEVGRGDLARRSRTRKILSLRCRNFASGPSTCLSYKKPKQAWPARA